MSETAQTTQTESPTERVGRSLWTDAVLRIRRDKVAMLCLGIILLYALVALGGFVYEVLAEYNDDIPSFIETDDYDHMNEAPSTRSWKTWFGTDWGGKSVLLKTILGTRISMSVGLITNIIAIPLGMLLGAIAGYFGGWIDDLIVWFYSTLSSIPGIILLIAVKVAFQDVTILGLDLGGIHGLYLALAVVSWIGTCRLVRAETLKLRELDYVVAARAIGTGRFKILLKHILPNVSHLGIINFSLGFVGAIKAEVMLSFLGTGCRNRNSQLGKHD